MTHRFGTQQEIVIGTHLGRFHADDVLAVATLRMVYPKATIVRTRDLTKLAQCDIVVDVGLIYDPENGRYDHHQKGGAGSRSNGIEYSSFGLVWKDYNLTFTDSPEVAQLVDEILVQSIDARDNGQSLTVENPAYDGAAVFCLADAIDAFNPNWDEASEHDKAFEDAVAFVTPLIEHTVRRCKSIVSAQKTVWKAIMAREDPRILILEKGCPWMNLVINEPEAQDIMFVLLLGEEGNWRVQTVPHAFRSHQMRKSLPKAWAGMQSRELSALTGVPDAHFCHNKLFICSARSRDGALRLAKLALEAD